MSVFVIIPAFREQEALGPCLESLNRSYQALSRTLQAQTTVVLVLNRPATEPFKASRDVLVLPQCGEGLPLDILDLTREGLRFGVGEARHRGFTQALKDAHDDDILVSLDADTWVCPTYLQGLHALRLRPYESGFLIRFTHDLLGPLGNAMALYERYLYYLEAGLHYAQSPFDFVALGSAMGTRAKTYKLSHGIPLKTATEDFHFMNKLRKLGELRRVDDIWVRPATRRSSRVTLGTGYFLECAATQSLSVAVSQLMLPSPEDFMRLKEFLEVLREGFMNPRRLACLDRSFRELMSPRVWKGICKASQEAKQPQDYARKLRERFDGLETLRFLRRLTQQRPKPTPEIFEAYELALKCSMSRLPPRGA